MNPTESAKSYVYYHALSFCISDRNLSSDVFIYHITETDALAGNWLSNPLVKTSPALGYFLSSKGLKTDGYTMDRGGDNEDWFMDAWKLWGLPNSRR